MTWTCDCGANVEPHYSVCTYCGKDRAAVGAPMPDSVAPSAHRRYSDAYRVATFFVSVGDILKWIGCGIGGLILLLGLASGSGFGIMGALVTGAVMAGIFFVLGILVAAQGQMLRATLDTAVNTSPVLTSEEKIQMMSLR